MNKILLIGNLGKDPEGKYTPNGKAVTTFRLAVTRKFTTASGETKEETEWFTIITWNKLAEICQEFLKKGKKVYVEGRLAQRAYTDREGVRRVAVEVVATDMEMLSPREQAAEEEVDEDVEALLAELEGQ